MQPVSNPQLDVLKRIAAMTDPDDPESYRSDDREGCLDTVHAIAQKAVTEAEEGVKPWGWYERYPGHHFVYKDLPDFIVHVCARGGNILAPVAMIETANYHSLLWERCDTVKAAQDRCRAFYDNLMKEQGHEAS